MDNFFSIGEVSKYQNISKQTLIFYDKIGLFKPAYVDPDNGYRYYSATQLDYLDTILIMKKAGFSLGEIREHMKAYNTESSLAILRHQITVIDGQIEELRQIRSRLAHRCSQIENAHMGGGKAREVTVEKTEGQEILVQEVAPPYGMQEISIATKKCFALAFQNRLPAFFQSGVSVPLSRIHEGRCTEAALAFLPLETRERPPVIREDACKDAETKDSCGQKAGRMQNAGWQRAVCRLPAGTVVCTFHVGDYMSIGNAYRRILDFCEKNGLEIVSDSYEFCINDYITTYDESEYITKIMFYVRT